MYSLLQFLNRIAIAIISPLPVYRLEPCYGPAKTLLGAFPTCKVDVNNNFRDIVQIPNLAALDPR